MADGGERSARAAPLLKAVAITKTFGDFTANDAIDLDLYPAEIHALLGENGAGKSTLVKIIYGLIQPNEGELIWQGHPVVLSGPAHAREPWHRHGVPAFLAIRESYCCGERRTWPFGEGTLREDQGAHQGRSSTKLWLRRSNQPRRLRGLSVGERQRIEIVRTLMQNPKLLILDEPTAVLTPCRRPISF